MEDNIELIIKLPKEIYVASQMLNVKPDDVVQIPLEIIANGIPLPKGHGDLIDRGKLKTHFIGTEQGTDLEVYLETTIMCAKAILKADKAGGEE